MSTSKAKNRHRDQGNHLFKEKNWTGAIQEYTLAIEQDRGNAMLYSNRSAAYVRNHEFDKALQDAELCIRLDPEIYQGYGRKGAAYHAMKRYDEAVEAYKVGLSHCPKEETLQRGLAAANRAKHDASRVHQAARRNRNARIASKSRTAKLRRAPSVSNFVMEARKEIQLKMLALQAQLDLLNELAKLNDDEKLELLFSLIDTDKDATIDTKELAMALRKRNAGLSLVETLEKAINAVAAFDTNGDCQLDLEEFKAFVKAMMAEVDAGANELAEYMVLQILFSDNDQDADDLSTVMSDMDITAKVQEQERFINFLDDQRVKDLFKMFDRDGSQELTFTEVAMGLFQLTNNMEESAQTTMGLLLMLDKDDKRTLNYEQFARLMMAVVATLNKTFDEIADELLLAMTTNPTVSGKDIISLMLADAAYMEALDARARENADIASIGEGTYIRLQKLFDLWDVDKDGVISSTELSRGLRSFQLAARLSDDADSYVKAVFDSGEEMSLDRQMFARAIVDYAKACGIELNEMIDFMCMTAVLKGDDAAEYTKAFHDSLGGATDTDKDFFDFDALPDN